jgi:hypothetical protein
MSAERQYVTEQKENLVKEKITIEQFTAQLLTWVLVIDEKNIRCSDNLTAFLQSRQLLGISGLQHVLYEIYEQLNDLWEYEQEKKEQLLKKFFATIHLERKQITL